MISSASGYEWVNVTPLSGFISGDIMPVRDNRGDGSWRRLKYEDLLFLMEARLERANWQLSAPSALVTPPGRALKYSACRNNCYIDPTASGWVQEYVDRSVAMPTGIISTSQTATIAAACGLSAPSFTTVPTFPGTTARLSADTLRAMYYNVKLATRTIIPVYFDQITDSWTVSSTTVYRDGGGYSGTSVSPGYLWSWLGTGRYGSSMDIATFTPKAALATYMHCTAATLLVKTDSLVEGQAGHFYDIIALSCSVTDGVAGVPSLGGIAAQIAAAHGINYSATPAYKETDGGSVSINSMALVVDNTFPAEINTLNWNWSPQST